MLTVGDNIYYLLHHSRYYLYSPGGLPARPGLRLRLLRGERHRPEVVPAAQAGAGGRRGREVHTANIFRDLLMRTISIILASGYGFGSVMWIPTETAFVNPGNIVPVSSNCSASNLTSGCSEEKYFTDEAVLEK